MASFMLLGMTKLLTARAYKKHVLIKPEYSRIGLPRLPPDYTPELKTTEMQKKKKKKKEESCGFL
jgi:hypothetical protein